jgi:hypothetical protein
MKRLQKRLAQLEAKLRYMASNKFSPAKLFQVIKSILTVEAMIENMSQPQKDDFFYNFEPDNSHAEKAEAMAAQIADCLPIKNNAQYQNIFSAACDVLENRCTFEEAVARLTSKKVIILR